MKLFQIFLAAALTTSCFAASAQWQWVDKDGLKVFSDRPPPSDIAEKNILKRPKWHEPSKAQVEVSAPEGTVEKTAPALALPVSSPKSSGADKELEAKKKQAADAETAKRQAEEQRIAKAKIENCARAKQAKATYESGVRIARTNAAGEREIMDDAARTAELQRIQGVIAADCR